MAIKTNIKTQQDLVIVSIEGHLDFETTDTFKENLWEIERKNRNARIVFDMSQLQFVGSSGITAFIQTLREFNTRAGSKPRYANLRSEFKKIISAFDENHSFEFWDNLDRAAHEIKNPLDH